MHDRFEGGFVALGPDTCHVVANGVVENHEELRHELACLHYQFKTGTDTEVIAHLFDHIARNTPEPAHHVDRAIAVTGAVAARLAGRFAFCVLSRIFPGVILAACSGSPLVYSACGRLASDPAALSGYASHYARLQDGHVLALLPGEARVHDRGRWRYLDKPDLPVPATAAADKDGHAHLMHKEIHEQPGLLEHFSPLYPEKLRRPKRVILFGCGSSYNACVLGRKYLEDLAGLPAQAEVASELLQRPLLGLASEGAMFIAVSQSGETADTIAVLEKLSRLKDACVMVVTNTPDSFATRLAGLVVLTGAPAEHAVAATKTFTLCAAALMELAGRLGGLPAWRHHISERVLRWDLPRAIRELLAKEDEFKKAALFLCRYQQMLYLGHGADYPVAMEGALKLKEVAYLHAEALPAAELKHGPIAMLDDRTLAVALLPTKPAARERVIVGIEEVRSRKGNLLILCSEAPPARVAKGEEQVVYVPVSEQLSQPLVFNTALQLLGYHAAILQGHDVDRPRHLAKSSTVA
jgi:glucosamine--fructose-6-phosphate aminotransferase (isomerizing)